MQLGALDCHVVDAREEFAREYVAPAIKANALYGGGYPLFTALGRPLIAKLAVEYARSDGLRHDRPRLHRQGQRPGADRGDGRDARARAEGDRAGALVADGPRGGDRLRARARHPDQGPAAGTEAAPYSIDDNLWGRSSEGRWIEDLEHAPEDDVFQLVTRPEDAPDEPETVELDVRARACRSRSNGERLELVELIERAAEIGARHGVGIVDHIEDRIVGLKVRDIYEVPAAAIVLPAHQELERLVCTIHQNQFKPQLDRQWAYLVYAGPVVGAAARRSRRLHGAGQRAGHRDDRPEAVQGPRAGGHALLAERRLRREPRVVRRVGRAVLPGRLARLHRAVVAAVADGLAPA